MIKSLPSHTVYPKKYAHGFVVLCFVVVMQSFIMNSHEVFIHIHQGCFAGTGAIVRLPQCQWSKPDGYGKISQSKQKPCAYFLGYTVKYGPPFWVQILTNSLSSTSVIHPPFLYLVMITVNGARLCKVMLLELLERASHLLQSPSQKLNLIMQCPIVAYQNAQYLFY